MSQTRPKVLVVEDERHIALGIVENLELEGYEATLAEDGQAGLDMFQEQHESLACVLMDMTMPRMNGETAARRMREIDADVPIILMSGFDEGEMATRFRDAGMAGFVQKPFEIRTLRETLRQATGRAD